MFCSESGSVVHRYLLQPQVHVYHGATLEDASVLGCADHSACPSGFLRVSTPFPADTWTHVAVVITRSHATATYGSAAVYWDGVEVASTPSLNFPLPVSRAGLYVGKSHWPHDHMFTGAGSSYTIPSPRIAPLDPLSQPDSRHNAPTQHAPPCHVRRCNERPADLERGADTAGAGRGADRERAAHFHSATRLGDAHLVRLGATLAAATAAGATAPARDGTRATAPTVRGCARRFHGHVLHGESVMRGRV